MRLLRRVLPTQDWKRPQDLIPKGDASGGPAPESGATNVYAGHGAGSWAWLDLNQRLILIRDRRLNATLSRLCAGRATP
jgi:hypothetical protein